MNLILCGMMGAGKTTIGIKIAELTGRRWYDTDGVIVDKHGQISDIFEYYGEAHFRKLETETVRELVKMDNLVLSTGGGLVLPIWLEYMQSALKDVPIYERQQPADVVEIDGELYYADQAAESVRTLGLGETSKPGEVDPVSGTIRDQIF